MWVGESGALVGPPGAPERVSGAPGMRRPDAALSDGREGEDRDPRVLQYEPVHGCLKRVVRAARVHLPLIRHRGQVLGHLVRQCAPESWMGSACTGLLYMKIMCFDLFDAFRGVKNGWHGDTPCLRMLPIGYGGCLLRSIQYGGTGAASGEGQSSIGVLSSLKESIGHDI